MARCVRCGEEFNLSTAKRSIGCRYGAGTYDDYYPDGDVCEDCAIEEVSADYATGEGLKDLMGTLWEDD